MSGQFLWADSPTDEGLLFFEQKIRPVLVQHCYSCHSKDAQNQKKLQGALFLDSSEGILAGGDSGPSLVKGQSAESLLLKAMKFDGREMPPSGKLSDEIIADFAKWIDLGAPDPRHADAPVKAKREINLDEGRRWWSFQPLRIVVPPRSSDELSSRTPIDGFLFATQAQKGLKQNGPTTREKLIRRAYFDLIGLPPTPEQVDAFLNDPSPRAFEAVVDGLLSSPRYGEKWARHWLDVARFAESGGYEFDGFRPGAYHYRDWVIRALNDDLPYDQFVRWQLAGDRLRPDDFLAASASGFLVAGPFPGQTTAKTIEGIRYDQLDDMLMTIGGSMLGLTLGCVRCHDHKYDPLPQKDYYALAATLAQTSHGSRYIDPNPAATQQAWVRHQQAAAPLVEAMHTFARDELPKRFMAWQAAELARQPESPRWQVMEPVALDAERSWLKWLPGGIIAHDGQIPPGTSLERDGKRRMVASEDRFTITLQTHQKNVTSFRLDAFADSSLPQRGPGLNGDGQFELTELKIIARPLDRSAIDAPQELKLKAVAAAFEDPNQPLGQAVDGKLETAWVVRSTAKKDNAAIFELEAPLAGFGGGTELVFELRFRSLGIGRMRFSLSTVPNPATWAGDSTPQNVGEIRAILAAHGNTLPESHRVSMTRWFAPFDVDTARVYQAVRNHSAAEPRPPLAEVYTTIAGGQDVYLLRRGEVDNKQGKAEPGYAQVLFRENSGSAPVVAATSSVPTDPRVALGNWMTNVDQGAGPLLARVIVNRVWQHHFGEGIVSTPNDFGAQGDRPSHPELLEWLATQLVTGGWKLKPLHKQILLSAAYQQSHEVSGEALQIDPTNRDLWHFQTRRLDAELIRDALLAVGGNLDQTMYGPSVLDDTTRRSVYLRVKRSELIPLMTMFDAPEPTQSVGERTSTTVPTQSLALMNSPFVRAQAEKLAQRIRPSVETPVATSIDLAYRIAFARHPTAEEAAQMQAFVDAQRTLIAGDPAASIQPALVEFCHVLLCLNEFVYID
ncbi:PSD1 and planctomycete cytochrome C domain-containing protein [Schlesneria paludicola]|uniref:PSD1 and planctomycete cytochrome C domain-containing protein n=1 Tax=Schlesneria paludicola TaxID=360056 RepID=UPI000680D4A9|nr:PSD1 and planctomycete cytochrome C domain-containing protein [Schlesneria paludicola]